MSKTEDIERFVREEDVETECSCAAKKCGPHRCGPSKLAWWVIGMLLVYLITMHSWQFAERGTFKHVLTKEMTELVEQHTQVAINEATRRFADVAGAERTAWLTSIDAQRAQIAQLLERAQRVNWALATPELERSIELQTRIDDLSASVSALAERLR